MFSQHSREISLISACISCFVLACITINFSTTISAQPTASIENLLGSSANKLDEAHGVANAAAVAATSAAAGLSKLTATDLSFQQFISSKPEESTIIGEIKPNASDLEKMLLRTKIANTIQGMQEMEKQRKLAPTQRPSSTTEASSTTTGSAECYIEVTRVEKVPGKCHRASSGLPICQSDNYMTITNECS